MNTTDTAGRITHSILRYYGGGWARAAWTVSHFPAHHNYVEPCFGAGSILFHKRPCKLETVNDVDGRVINFFEVLRARPHDLIRHVELTPWAQAEFEQGRHPADDPLEDARRFFIMCWASIQGGPNPPQSNFRWQKKATRRKAAVHDVTTLDHLHTAARRLKNVQILNRDALDVIRRFIGLDCLLYFDPPYLHTTRSKKDGYRHEVTADWHVQAAELLRQFRGPVVVSGYPSDLYKELYERHDWQRVEKAANTNSGSNRTEALWLSPITQKAIHRGYQANLQFQEGKDN